MPPPAREVVSDTGNGHPMGAILTTPEIAAPFDNGMESFSTFGGNPVSFAVGMVALDVIESEALQRRALEVGDRLIAGLKRLQTRHEIIGDVRDLRLNWAWNSSWTAPAGSLRGSRRNMYATGCATAGCWSVRTASITTC